VSTSRHRAPQRFVHLTLRAPQHSHLFAYGSVRLRMEIGGVYFPWLKKNAPFTNGTGFHLQTGGFHLQTGGSHLQMGAICKRGVTWTQPYRQDRTLSRLFQHCFPQTLLMPSGGGLAQGQERLNEPVFYDLQQCVIFRKSTYYSRVFSHIYCSSTDMLCSRSLQNHIRFGYGMGKCLVLHLI
jgi:hypothetical protein